MKVEITILVSDDKTDNRLFDSADITFTVEPNYPIKQSNVLMWYMNKILNLIMSESSTTIRKLDSTLK